jgi:hypothetical protein
MMGRALLVAMVLAWPAAEQAQAGCLSTFFPPRTIRQEAVEASAVVFATATASRLKDGNGETDFTIDAVLRDHPALKGKKGFTALRYLPLEKGKPQRFLIFLDVHKGAIDPYRGIPLCGKGSLEYAKKATALRRKALAGDLGFYFRHLEDADPEVARDAHAEFAAIGDDAIVKAALLFDVKKLRAWLRKPRVPRARYDLYARLLGACGKKADAEFVGHLLRTRGVPSIEGLMVAQALLSPKEGLAFLRAVAREQKPEFMRQYALIRAMRFLYQTRPGAVSKDDLAQTMALLLENEETADLAIEDLRRWQRWEMADKVLGQTSRPAFDRNKHLKRAVLRYCLQCTGRQRTAAHVALRRAKDAQEVKDAQELLDLEGPAKGGKP